jgi:hypothetical protein
MVGPGGTLHQMKPRVYSKTNDATVLRNNERRDAATMKLGNIGVFLGLSMDVQVYVNDWVWKGLQNMDWKQGKQKKSSQYVIRLTFVTKTRPPHLESQSIYSISHQSK